MRFAGGSDKGKTRTSNQDEFAVLNDREGNFLAIVCDGVGGGNHGEIASHMTVSCMKQKFEDNEGFKDLEDAQAWLFTSIKQTNQTVYMRGITESEYAGMGTTLVAFLKTKHGSLMANVGDSRGYALGVDDVFRAVTVDHSYVAKLVQTGQISIQEAMVHPQRHVITNAIGIWDDITIDFYPIGKDVKSILLCSDGLHDYVSERLIAAIMREQTFSPEEKVKRLIDAANLAGGYDNVTAVAAEGLEADHE